MPVARGPNQTRIEDALAALSRALSEAGAPWMVIGGIAVIAHGVQRMTTDIDVVIQGDAVPVATLIDLLRGHRIVARIPEAEAFAATNLVLLTRHEPTQVDLDVSFGWTAFEREALAARVLTRYGKVAAPMAGVEELITFKVMAARPRDFDDAITLVTLYPGIDFERVRRHVTTLAELAGAPELLRGLDQVLRGAPTSTESASPGMKELPQRRRAKQIKKRGKAAARRKIRKAPR